MRGHAFETWTWNETCLVILGQVLRIKEYEPLCADDLAFILNLLTGPWALLRARLG